MSAFKNNTSKVCDFEQEIYLGGVEVWISELGLNNRVENFRCMGCAEDATLTIDETKLEVAKACEGIRSVLEFITQTKKTLKFTVQNATLQNLAEFLAGTVSTYANPAVAGVTSVVIVSNVAAGGNGIVLGSTLLLQNSAGDRIYDFDHTKLTVEESTDNSMWTALGSDDFSYDEAAGTIRLIPAADGGDGTPGASLRFSLTADAGALTPIAKTDSGSVGKRYVALRLVASNGTQNEEKSEVLVYSCFLGSDGDLALSGTDIAKIGFSGTCAENSFYGTDVDVVNVP